MRNRTKSMSPRLSEALETITVALQQKTDDIGAQTDRKQILEVLHNETK